MRPRRYILLLLDIVIIVFSFCCALLLRFEGHIYPVYWTAFLNVLPWIALITAVTFLAVDLYNRLWRYASISEMLTIVKAVTLVIAVIFLGSWGLGIYRLPRSVYIMAWLLGIVLIGSSRLWWRMFREYLMQRGNQRRICIVGTGETAVKTAGMLKGKAVGFISEEKPKRRVSIRGIPVLGYIKEIPEIVNSYQVDEIVVVGPFKKVRVREIIQVCKDLKVVVKVIDQGGNGAFPRLRQASVDDLLGREPVNIDDSQIAACLQDRVVLVTGAGGSIGSELCRQIVQFKPRLLVALDCSEASLFELEQELAAKKNGFHLETVLADIRDTGTLKSVFEKYRPAAVFHAAAYKHVPMMERFPEQAWTNNVLGTRNVLDCCRESGVETLIFVSTDKAVNPANAMGASKRLGELMVARAAEAEGKRWAAVRFGNVLGSRGSVIPIFLRQIEAGGPVTVTDPEMKRFFMTIPEAARLVLQAAAMARGGEIFVLDMGEPVSIMELAEDMIRLSGLRPGEDIEIQVTGSRPGEKLDEELTSAEENLTGTAHSRIMAVSNHRYSEAEFQDIIHRFFPFAGGGEAGDKTRVPAVLGAR